MADLSVDCPSCAAVNTVPPAADSDTFTCSQCGVESSIDAALGALGTDTEPVKDYLVGEVIGECRIIAKVGEGGFGAVYKATDQTLQRTVAVKVMLQSLSSNIEFVQKFTREAVTAAQLSHPNLMAIINVGRDDRRGLHYLIMEFIEGKTLSEVVHEKGVLSNEDLIPIALQTCDALATAHEAHIVHRDIKPDNLMIDEAGVVKITDFGLAKSLASNSNTTKVMGTPHYMSPEQFEGTQVDGRSDIYSLGVTFYFLLSKERPYEGENTVQIIYSILTQDPKPLPEVSPGVSPEIWAIVQKMIAKKADDRYQTLRDTITDLRKLQKKATPDRSECAGCGAKNPKGRKFCRGCGAALLVKCPACGHGEPARTTECSKCGADLARLVKAKKALQAGKRFKALGDLRRSEEAFREALELGGDNPEASAELSEITSAISEVERFKSEADDLLHTGEMEAALRHMDELLRKHPTAVEVREHRDKLRKQVAAHRVNALFEEAETAAADGDIRRALERLDAALRVDPDRKDVRERREHLARQVTQVTESRTKAVEALAAGRYEDAFALASDVLKMTPGDAAMEEVRRKSKDSVASVDSVVSQGRELMEAREWSQALSKFEAALALRPGDRQFLTLVEDARGKITAHRERMSRCRNLIADGQHVEAAEELQALLDKQPDDMEAVSLLESCHQLAAEAERAGNVTNALKAAQAMEQTGDLSNALGELKKALEYDPQNDDARSKLREVETRLRNEQNVRELADEHLQDGRYDDAIEALERLRAVNPNRGAEIDAEIADARNREKQVGEHVRLASEALSARQFRRAAESAGAALALAPRFPRATAIRKDAEKAVSAIDRFLAEADRLMVSEMFDEAQEVIDKARERGAAREEYESRRRECEQGQLALLKTDATRSLVSNDYEAAIAVYEQVLEVSGGDEDALAGKRSAERRMRVLTTEPLSLRLGTAAVVLLLLGVVHSRALADRPEITQTAKQRDVDTDDAEVVVRDEPNYETLDAREREAASGTIPWSTVLAEYETELGIDKFRSDERLQHGRDFCAQLDVATTADSETARLDALEAARAFAVGARELRRFREGVIDEVRRKTANDWIARVNLLANDVKYDEVTAQLSSMLNYAVVQEAAGFEELDQRDAAFQFLRTGDQDLQDENFAFAVSSYQQAAEGDPNTSSEVGRKLEKVGREWMSKLKSRMDAAPNDDVRFEVYRELAEYARAFDVTAESAHKQFKER